MKSGLLISSSLTAPHLRTNLSSQAISSATNTTDRRRPIIVLVELHLGLVCGQRVLRMVLLRGLLHLIRIVWVWVYTSTDNFLHVLGWVWVCVACRLPIFQASLVKNGLVGYASHDKIEPITLDRYLRNWFGWDNTIFDANIYLFPRNGPCQIELLILLFCIRI